MVALEVEVWRDAERARAVALDGGLVGSPVGAAGDLGAMVVDELGELVTEPVDRPVGADRVADRVDLALMAGATLPYEPLTEEEVERLGELARELWGPRTYGLIARAWVLFGAWVGRRPGETLRVEGGAGWRNMFSARPRSDRGRRVRSTHLGSTRDFSVARSFATASASRLKSSSVISGRWRMVKTTSHPSPSLMTRSGL